MRWYHMTGMPSAVPEYRIAAALAHLVRDEGCCDIAITEAPPDPWAGSLVTGRTLTAVLLVADEPLRCRCGAVAVFGEVVRWRGEAGEATTHVRWCTSCWTVEEQECVDVTRPVPHEPVMAGTLDAWTIVEDWEEERQNHDDAG